MPHQNSLDSSADPSSRSSRERRLNLRVLNAETGDGIPAVQVELHQDGRRVAAARSDKEGRAAFAQLKPGAYQVIQASYPKQMTGISAKPVVQVGKDGSLHLGSEPVREIRMLNFHLRH
ncbi:MAG: carboxypeptidase regulatory-like domain-containing protein [Oscillospiraceae bacterium]|jgi:hypothetical protein|nr:carboxypeptidase regulatory-like domain-containing protein [Oscillospiraceae bacterium]